SDCARASVLFSWDCHQSGRRKTITQRRKEFCGGPLATRSLQHSSIQCSTLGVRRSVLLCDKLRTSNVRLRTSNEALHDRILSSTLPATSVRRKRRPLCR